jgi:uncharacterized membrane-anchored protein
MRNWFIGIVALQLCFVGGEAAMYQARLRGGEEVLLKVVPIDPRSLFMGRYMNLGYDISRLDTLKTLGGGASTRAYRDGQVVWVGLRPQKPYARVVSVNLDKPAPDPGIVYLKGVCRHPSGWFGMVHYGIERYYIPEAREHDAQILWEQIRTGRTTVTASISVDANGKALIRHLYANGKEVGY